MAVEVPEDELRALISSLSGVDESCVLWDGEPEPVIGPIEGTGKSGKITLNVAARATNGTEETRSEFKDADEALPAGYEETIGAHRTLTISVRADCFDGYGEAFDLLELVRLRLAKRKSRKALRDMGLAFVDVPSIVSLDYNVDNRAISAASMDLRVAQVVTETDADERTPYIEKVSKTTPADPSTAPAYDLTFERVD